VNLRILWRGPLSLRASITLWYVGAVLVVLALYATAVYAIVSRNLSRTLDAQLRGDFQWAAAMGDPRPAGTNSWLEEQTNEDLDGPWIQVWSPGGTLVYRSAAAGRNPIPGSTELAANPDQGIVSVPMQSKTWRILTGKSVVEETPMVIQVALTETSMKYELHRLLIMLVLGLPIGVVAAGLSAYALARRALAPVERMAERARSITAERLSDRLPVDNPNDELGTLASVFNATLGRLESSFDQMRRFTADVSHELRTPLTAIRSVGEVGLRGPRDANAYRGIIGSMLEEVDRLACLVDRLLSLSRAELGQAKLSREAVDLRALAEEVSAHLGVLAEEKQQTMTVETEGSPRGVCDRLMLRQSLINLVDNAIKYTPSGGRIRLRAVDSPTAAMLEIADNGPGIVEELRGRIFDRYYRAGGPLASEAGGAGLGLSITKWSIEVNGGDLTVDATEGGGSTFRISLPRADAGRQVGSRRRTA
jgi:heavy metal sensor kinase